MTELLIIALSKYGTKELPGGQHEADILKYFEEIGHQWVKDDETPWCAAFMNWCCLKAGYKGTGKLNARSFLDAGEKVETPELGDVVIFSRDNDPAKGHVGIFIREKGDMIFTLGGNQSNQVSIWPYLKNRVIGYRRLTKI
jgi:uncharacterized protein (TIGR02594 family)